VARALWRPAPDFTTAAEAWLAAGGPHHTVLSSALNVETIADFAQIAGVELLVIDGDTRMREFANEMRWNDAAHRIAPER
jgi:L-arabinose isomerase